MIMFWFLAALMIAAVLLWILPPLLRPSPPDEKPGAATVPTDESERINLALYRERMEELNREYRDRRIDKERYEILRDDLERGLIADIGIAEDPGDPEDSKTGGEDANAAARSDALEGDIPSPPSTHGSSGSSLRCSMPIALGLAIPIFGIVVYLQVGTPRAIDPGSVAVTEAGGSEGGALSAEEKSDLERMANRLETELEGNPDDAESWILLARARMDLDDPGAAIGAYERAHAIQGDDPSILADWAQAEIDLSNSPSFPQSAIDRIERALGIDPDHQGALWIGGFASFQQGQRETALARWERLQALLPRQSPEAELLAEWLVRVRSGALADQGPDQGQGESSERSAPVDDSMPGRDPETNPRKSDTAEGSEGDPESAVIDSQVIDSSAPRIEVEVDIEPGLAKTLGGDEAIFVFARPAPDASGAKTGAFGPPLAIVRTTLAALPTSVVLDESSAMIAGRSLSSADKVIVSARLSRAGTAERASGDIEGSSGPVPTVGSKEPVRILLSQVVP